jgi:nucleotide-binding universal stress UspA family protein
MKDFSKDIVVPVNFSENTDNSLEEAVFLAKKLKSKIHLINVIEITDWWNNLVLSKDVKEKLNQLSTENLKNLISKYDDVEFEYQVLYGRIHEQILSYSESVNAGLIVLCDKHKIDQETKILGSIVTHVITESKIPVITIKDKIDTEINNIIVPIDLSEDSETQIKSAISFNKHCNATLHFVSVLFDAYRNRNRRVRSKAKYLEHKLKEYDLKYTMNLIKKKRAYAYQDILQFSDNLDADLVFLMTHKEHYKFDNYIGAFAHRIINYSKVPVMTITSTAANSARSSFINQFIDPLGVFDTK